MVAESIIEQQNDLLQELEQKVAKLEYEQIEKLIVQNEAKLTKQLDEDDRTMVKTLLRPSSFKGSKNTGPGLLDNSTLKPIVSLPESLYPLISTSQEVTQGDTRIEVESTNGFKKGMYIHLVREPRPSCAGSRI